MLVIHYLFYFFLRVFHVITQKKIVPSTIYLDYKPVIIIQRNVISSDDFLCLIFQQLIKIQSFQSSLSVRYL